MTCVTAAGLHWCESGRFKGCLSRTPVPCLNAQALQCPTYCAALPATLTWHGRLNHSHANCFILCDETEERLFHRPAQQKHTFSHPFLSLLVKLPQTRTGKSTHSSESFLSFLGKFLPLSPHIESQERVPGCIGQGRTIKYLPTLQSVTKLVNAMTRTYKHN